MVSTWVTTDQEETEGLPGHSIEVSDTGRCGSDEGAISKGDLDDLKRLVENKKRMRPILLLPVRYVLTFIETD